MDNSININSNQFYLLENDIRISATSTFSAQNAFESVFEDVAADIAAEDAIQTQEKQKTPKINLYNLGPPAGFFIDTSAINEVENSYLNT